MLPYRQAQILRDYMCLHQAPVPAGCIGGFGCYNEDIPRRAAQLYKEGFAPWVLFTGGLGRNTAAMWSDSEALRFARIAASEGVPESAILVEDKSTNTAENILFTKALLEARGITPASVLGVHKPYMERRLFAAFPVYWPEAEVTVTSWQQSYEEYVSGVGRWGRTEADTISMIVGDFQRVLVYPKLGYQIPQNVPEAAMEAFDALVKMGYVNQLI